MDTSQFYDTATSDGRFLERSDRAADAAKLEGRELASLARVGGIVNKDAPIVSGTGFTVTRNYSGQYRLEFPPGTFDCSRRLPIVVANSAGEMEARIPKMHGYGCFEDGTVVVLLLFQQAGGASVDTSFTFIAM